MQKVGIHIIRFLLFVLAQGLIIGQFEFGWGIHPMIYPLFILLLPFETAPVVLMLLGFILGISVDFFMNTFGLHASAGVLVAYIRPELYRLFSPRDGYDTIKEPTAQAWGYTWFLSVSSITVFIHHLWFFSLEIFKFSEIWEIIKSSVLSTITTLIIFTIIQILFFKKEKQ